MQYNQQFHYSIDNEHHVKEKIDSGDFTEQSHSHMTLQASLKIFIPVLHCPEGCPARRRTGRPVASHCGHEYCRPRVTCTNHRQDDEAFNIRDVKRFLKSKSS